MRLETKGRIAVGLISGLLAGGSIPSFYASSNANSDASRHNITATSIEKQIEQALPPAAKKLQTQLNGINALLAHGASDTPTGQELMLEQQTLQGRIAAIELKDGQWTQIRRDQQERAAEKAANDSADIDASLGGALAGIAVVTAMTGFASFRNPKRR